MAFTDVEVKEAHNAISGMVRHEDLLRLGLIYSTELEDRGPDYIEAHKWFNLAAMMGSQPAKAYRSEIVMEMNAAEVTLAQRAARSWLKKNEKLLRQARPVQKMAKAA